MGGSSSSTAFNYDAQLLSDTKEQSIQVGEEVKGETRARRSKAFPTILSHPFPEEKGGLTTIWEGFQRGVTKHPKANCLGTRKYDGVDEKREYKKASDGLPKRTTYVWEDYALVDQQARAFGSGLVEIGAKAKDNIGIWAVNRAEWIISSLGFYSQNMRTVSLYATLGDEAVQYIINHAELGVVVTEKENVKKLIQSIPKLPVLKTIIQFDPNELYGTHAEYLDENQVKAAADAGVRLIGFSEVIKMGTAKANFPVPPTEEDLAFVMYTSGTTGMPKGALLRHGNVMAAVAACPAIFNLREGQELHVSYLPLAHIFETVVLSAIFAVGGACGFFQGNVKKLTNDFIDLQPTILCGVPRVFSKIYQKVFQGVQEKNCMVKWYFNKAYAGQCDNLRNGRPRDAKYDNKVFIPLRTRVGMGRCRIMITGAAPCPPYLLEFLRVITPGGIVVQGYGLTETSAASTITVGTDPNVGHAGPPLPCNEIKLVDVPEMNYFSTDKDPRGEIWVHGPNIFAGYYKNEEATREALDEKGWLRTGDVGRWNPNGTLSIIDRKKNIFKLSQGEYIAAEKIETVYGKSPIVGQVWVYGNSYKPFCMAVVVPAADIVANYCHEKGWWPSPKEASVPGTTKFSEDFAAVFAGPHADELKKHVHDTMKQQESALKGFEKVQDILIESRIDNQMAGFTEANECLTPTFKIRRPFLLQRYMAQLKALYVKHGEPDKPDEKWPGEK